MNAAQEPGRPPHKPRGLIDPRLLQPSLLASAAFLAYASALYLLPLAGLIALSSAGWGLAITALRGLLTALSGYGLFVLATTGHEGFHFNLAKNRRLSCMAGCLFSSMMPLFCATGFFIFHWRHHRHNNGPEDPDYAHFSRYPHPLHRIGLARIAITLRYLAATVDAAWHGSRTDAASPLVSAELQRLARFNLLCQTGGLALYAWPLWSLPGFALSWIPVLCVATVVSSLNAYQEHAFAPGMAQTFARSRTATLLTWLHAGSNYHLEHHLYPAVPCWRLPQVHRALLKAGWYDDKKHLLEAGVISTFRFAHSHYRYGGHPMSPHP